MQDNGGGGGGGEGGALGWLKKQINWPERATED